MKVFDGFTNWLRGLVTPARTTSQMLAEMDAEDLIGTERRRRPSAAEPMPGTPLARPSGVRSPD